MEYKKPEIPGTIVCKSMEDAITQGTYSNWCFSPDEPCFYKRRLGGEKNIFCSRTNPDYGKLAKELGLKDFEALIKNKLNKTSLPTRTNRGEISDKLD